MYATRNKLLKTALAIEHGLRNRQTARKVLANLYNERIVTHGLVPLVTLGELIGTIPEIRLVNFVPEHGNVTPFELVCLCGLIRSQQPSEVLELGTFNGNTTLQIAANLGANAHISTLDLPLGSDAVSGNDIHDATLINTSLRERPRYQLSAYADRVTQHYGNSLETDFATLNPRAPQFIFVDAGHSYACVKNDTEKSLAVLAPHGMLVWHDYTQDWPDVFNYLNELARQLPLQHVQGTNLVVYQKIV